MQATIDLTLLHPPTVFRVIRERGGVDDADMLRTFNLGAGLIAVVAPGLVERVRIHLGKHGYESAVIGEIVANGDVATGKVGFVGAIGWG